MSSNTSSNNHQCTTTSDTTGAQMDLVLMQHDGSEQQQQSGQQTGDSTGKQQPLLHEEQEEDYFFTGSQLSSLGDEKLKDSNNSSPTVDASEPIQLQQQQQQLQQQQQQQLLQQQQLQQGIPFHQSGVPLTAPPRTMLALTIPPHVHHASLLENSDDSSSGSQSPTTRMRISAQRRKINFACTECRKAHKGCNGERPCQRCKKLGIEDKCKSTVRKKNRVLANKYWKSILNAAGSASGVVSVGSPSSTGNSPDIRSPANTFSSTPQGVETPTGNNSASATAGTSNFGNSGNAALASQLAALLGAEEQQQVQQHMQQFANSVQAQTLNQQQQQQQRQQQETKKTSPPTPGRAPATVQQGFPPIADPLQFGGLNTLQKQAMMNLFYSAAQAAAAATSNEIAPSNSFFQFPQNPGLLQNLLQNQEYSRLYNAYFHYFYSNFRQEQQQLSQQQHQASVLQKLLQAQRMQQQISPNALNAHSQMQQFQQQLQQMLQQATPQATIVSPREQQVLNTLPRPLSQQQHPHPHLLSELENGSALSVQPLPQQQQHLQQQSVHQDLMQDIDLSDSPQPLASILNGPSNSTSTNITSSDFFSLFPPEDIPTEEFDLGSTHHHQSNIFSPHHAQGSAASSPSLFGDLQLTQPNSQPGDDSYEAALAFLENTLKQPQ